MSDEFFEPLFKHLESKLAAMEARILTQIRLDPNTISYSLEDAAKHTGIGYDTLYARCKSGKLEYSQDGPGAAIIIKRQTLIDHVDKHCKTKPHTETGDVESEIRLHGGSFQKVHRRKTLTGD
jgi:hypothetical protein